MAAPVIQPAMVFTEGPRKDHSSLRTMVTKQGSVLGMTGNWVL